MAEIIRDVVPVRGDPDSSVATQQKLCLNIVTNHVKQIG